VRRARGARRLAPFAAPRVCALLAALVLGFSACTSAPPYGQREYVVRAGDTLFSIAWQHGVDQRDLARWNGIKNPDLIRVGQRLRLSPPAAVAASQAKGSKAASAPTHGSTASNSAQSASVGSPSSGGTATSSSSPSKPAPEPALPNLPPPQWAWPADGQVVTRFGSHEGIATGVGIGGRAGDPVRAAAAGRVVYAGSGLVGYGQLVIIKHNETYLTAYGYNSELLVMQGQDVTRGQRIASMGLGPERQPRLHFEIRRNGVPVDPLTFFPGR
jgi:lipoprotein NlpD